MTSLLQLHTEDTLDNAWDTMERVLISVHFPKSLLEMMSIELCGRRRKSKISSTKGETFVSFLQIELMGSEFSSRLASKLVLHCITFHLWNENKV